MRLSYAMELVVAAGVGMALTRYRLTDPDYVEFCGVLTWIVRLEDGIDAFFEGVALVGGLGILLEQARGKSPRIWGTDQVDSEHLAAIRLLPDAFASPDLAGFPGGDDGGRMIGGE